MGSDTLLGWTIFALFFAIVIAVLVWRSSRRLGAWRKVARRLGLDLVEDGIVLPAGADRLRLLRVGHSQSAGPGLHGEIDGHRVWLLDWSWESGRGENLRWGTFVVALLQCPGLALPHLELRPEGLKERLVDALGGTDIDLPEDPNFSRRYRLRGDDPAAVRRCLTPTVRRVCTDRPGVWLETIGDLLLVARREELQLPLLAEGLLVDGRALVAAFTADEPGA